MRLATGSLNAFAPGILLAAPGGEKVRLACIGIGNRGAHVIRSLSSPRNGSESACTISFLLACSGPSNQAPTLQALKMR